MSCESLVRSRRDSFTQAKVLACERRRERLVVVVGGDGIGTMMMMMTRLILFLGVNDGVVL